MELTTVIPWIVFGVVTIMLWAMMNFFSSEKSRATERLDELRDPTLRGGEKAGSGPKSMNVLEKAAPKLSKALEPKSELEQNQLKVRLANAGFNSSTAPQMFLSVKLILFGLFAVIGVTFGLMRFGPNMQGMTAIAICISVGLYGPEIWLWLVRRGRMERIFLGLPDALDLLVVCVEAGLGLDAGMRRVAEELEDSAPDVAFEFNMCNMQLQMGRQRRQVLHDIGIRSGVDDMKSLAAILIQADKFGSSIASALRTQSDSMRVKRRQIAEEKAQKTAVQMLFPLIMFIFPSVFIVLVGPAAIMMMENLLKD